MSLPTPSNGPLSSSRLRPGITDTPLPILDPAAAAEEAARNKARQSEMQPGSEVDMELPPVVDKAESSDIFSPGGRRGSDVLSANGPSDVGLSELFTGDPSLDNGSDVLAGKLKSGESDVLAAMLFGTGSEVLPGSSACGSSQFDDPVHATEPISAPVPRTDDTGDGLNMPDAEEGEELTDRMPRPEIRDPNDVTHELIFSDEDINMVAGSDLIPPEFTLSRSSAKTAADSDDIFGGQTLPEFDDAEASGVNLLEPGLSVTSTAGPASGVNLLEPGLSVTSTAGPASGVNLLNPDVGVNTPAPMGAPSSGLNASALHIPKGAGGKTQKGSGGTKPPSSLITPEDLTKDVKAGPGSDVFSELGKGDSNPIGSTRSSILPGASTQPSDAISFDLPENRIKQPERLRGYEGSGMIDWSEGAGMDSDVHSQRMQMISDDRTEHDIDLHEGLLADAAAGKGYTKSPGEKSNARDEREPRTAPVRKTGIRTKTNVGDESAPSRNGLYTGLALGVVAASVVGFGLFFSGVLALQDSRVNANNYALLKEGNSKLSDYNQKLEDTLAKTKAQAESYRSERDRQSTDKVQLGEEKLRLERSNEELAAMVQDARTVRTERDKIAAAQRVLADELKAAKTRATRAEQSVAEKDGLAVAARSAATVAEAKLKLADAALDAVVKELKGAAWVDPKADRTTALAALPVAIKRAAEGSVAIPTGGAAVVGVAGSAGQLLDLAKKVTAAREEAVKFKAEAVAARDAAEKSLTLAKADARKTTAALEAKVKALTDAKDAEVQKAVVTIKADFEGKLAAADARAARSDSDRKAAIDAYEKKLQTLTEAFHRDLSLARAGIAVSVTDAERRATERAEKLYGEGLTAYFEGRWSDAETALSASTRADAADARRWYFLGLARWARGNSSAAAAAFRTGAEWEARNAPNSNMVGNALERIQGPARQELDAIRP